MSARFLNSRISSMHPVFSASLRISSYSIPSILSISWLVRKPSKKCRNGTFALSVERCATSARSIASWTELDASMAKPVWRHAITSEWSPNMLSACAASARALTWKTVGKSSPDILYILGIMSSKPWLAVYVVVSAPAASEP